MKLEFYLSDVLVLCASEQPHWRWFDARYFCFIKRIL